MFSIELNTKSIHDVALEIDQLKNKYPQIKTILLKSSDAINANFNFVADLCDAIRSKNINFIATIKLIPRQDYITLFKMMKRANFDRLILEFDPGLGKRRQRYNNTLTLDLIEYAQENNICLSLGDSLKDLVRYE